MQTLPYINEHSGTPYARLIIEPTRKPATETESGLIVPSQESNICQTGTVYATGPESVFKKGDQVIYQKINRQNNDQVDSIDVEGSAYDVIFEREVWGHNDKPCGRIWVRPLSGVSVTESGLDITTNIKEVTRKGVVVAAPKEYGLEEGDLVEYRNPIGNMFGQVEVDGHLLDVLFENDIFRINGKVAPYRIIVKIDSALQYKKRSSTDSGLLLSQLFIRMKHNLQFAEVTEVGTEAKKLYDVKCGDTVIIHHTVESQPYRLIKRDVSEHAIVKFEYLVIDCWDPQSHEIFGKLHYKKETGEILDITPMNGVSFLEWDFELCNQPEHSPMLEPLEHQFSKCKNLYDLRSVVDSRKKEAASKAKAKSEGIQQVLAKMREETNPDKFKDLETELAMIRREETMIAAILNHNHAIVGKMAYPYSSKNVITCYQELYPIELFKSKFLIVYDSVIMATMQSKHMENQLKGLLPLNDFVFVKPMDEMQSGELLIPHTAKEKPQRGEVLAKPYTLEGVSVGETILFRRGAGMFQRINGIDCLILRRNEVIATVTEEALA